MNTHIHLRACAHTVARSKIPLNVMLVVILFLSSALNAYVGGLSEECEPSHSNSSLFFFSVTDKKIGKMVSNIKVRTKQCWVFKFLNPEEIEVSDIN